MGNDDDDVLFSSSFVAPPNHHKSFSWGSTRHVGVNTNNPVLGCLCVRNVYI
jgi:hypothetical protein